MPLPKSAQVVPKGSNGEDCEGGPRPYRGPRVHAHRKYFSAEGEHEAAGRVHQRTGGSRIMNSVIYLIGLVVVVLAILSFLGLH